MRKICKVRRRSSSASELPRAEAIKFMEEREEPYKVELINDLPEDATISFYKQGEFTDLCAGPHLDSTGRVKGTRTADERYRRLLARRFLQEDAAAYLRHRHSRSRRAHQHPQHAEEAVTITQAKKEARLFMIEEGPGFPFFLPNGMTLKNNFIDYWREVHKRYGYVEVSTPMISTASCGSAPVSRDRQGRTCATTVIDDEDYAIADEPGPGGMLVY